MSSLLVVETQRGNYIFHCPSAAKAFAKKERQWWQDHCPGLAYFPIRSVPFGQQHKFRVPAPPLPGSFSMDPFPLYTLPSQRGCRRVQRHLHRWWSARDAWCASLA